MKIFKYSLIFLALTVLAGYAIVTGYLVDSFYSTKIEIDKLGHIGSFYNVITALTSVITVCLVAYAVYLQKEELKGVQQQMKNQVESLERDERINRTLKFIDEWKNALKRDEEGKGVGFGINEDEQRIKFIDKIIFLSEIKGELSKFLSTDSLKQAMIKDGMLDDINHAIDFIKNNTEGFITNERRNELIKNFELRKKFLESYDNK